MIKMLNRKYPFMKHSTLIIFLIVFTGAVVSIGIFIKYSTIDFIGDMEMGNFTVHMVEKCPQFCNFGNCGGCNNYFTREIWIVNEQTVWITYLTCTHEKCHTIYEIFPLEAEEEFCGRWQYRWDWDCIELICKML